MRVLELLQRGDPRSARMRAGAPGLGRRCFPLCMFCSTMGTRMFERRPPARSVAWAAARYRPLLVRHLRETRRRN